MALIGPNCSSLKATSLLCMQQVCPSQVIQFAGTDSTSPIDDTSGTTM